MHEDDRAARESFLAQVTLRAVEAGGVTEWADVVEYSYNLTSSPLSSTLARSPHGGDDARVVLVERNTEHLVRRQALEVTPTVIGKAFRQMHYSGRGELPLECIPGGVSAAWREHVQDARRRNCSNDIDVTDADMLVQIGLFGKVRYY